MRTLFALTLSVLFVVSVTAQDIYEKTVKADISIQGIEKNKDEIHFSLYLNTTKTSDSDLMLDNADFVLNFNQDVFTNPALSKATDHANTFVSTDLTNPNDAITKLNVQKLYTDALSTKIVGGKLVINLSGRAPGSQQVMTTNVARIGTEASTYCLGRFKVSGFSGSVEDVKLSWDLGSRGLVTQLFTVNELTAESTPVAIEDASIMDAIDTEQQPQVEISGMTIAPNPTFASAQVFVESATAKSSRLVVMDVNGKTVMQEQLELLEGVNTIKIDVDNLPAGSYFISIGEETGKLIKL